MTHAAAPPKIEFRNVCLHYFGRDGETEALRDIGLSIAAGEFVAIVGQSGCGKSTLLSLLAGLLQPTTGQVLIDGKPVTGPSPSIGFMLQQDTLFEWRTILENTVLGPEIRGENRAAARARAEALLERYGLGAFKHHRPAQLSGGMRQRAALARTMCLEPDILLLDEPFSALDFQTRLSLGAEIGSIIRNAGKTAILVTHDIPEAISIADRVVVLSRRPGRVRSEHGIAFPSCGATRPTAIAARDAVEFPALFDTVWQELDVHVD
jgi:NitT/TauT family transport system ATP-binding protein